MTDINPTHDPSLRSWVESANRPGHDFPVQNLPFVVFGFGDGTESRIGTGIGDFVLDLRACAEDGLLDEISAAVAEACISPTLNRLMAAGTETAGALRVSLSSILGAGSASATRDAARRNLVPTADCQFRVPADVPDYTDFYASIHHASNVGRMFRPDNPLLPNYRYVPIGYHGRASSIVVSGTAVRRPMGQVKGQGAERPEFRPTGQLDYEVEVGIFVGPGNSLGEPIPIEAADWHLFGLSLVNDWSARDIQQWEYQPLGPFLSKSFATSVSPWVVTREALAPFRSPARRSEDDPEPLPYLDHPDNRSRGGFDLVLEAWLETNTMRQRGVRPVRLSRALFASIYWTPAQLIAHHASNGCPLRPGDLLASGTVSGPTSDSRGCLLEITRRGAEPIELPTGEVRRFLEDGDEVTIRGWCERDGFTRIGMGECRGSVVAAGGF
jgi:fumarylacetoacetase